MVPSKHDIVEPYYLTFAHDLYFELLHLLFILDFDLIWVQVANLRRLLWSYPITCSIIVLPISLLPRYQPTDFEVSIFDDVNMRWV